MVREKMPDIALLDVMMPEMDGFETLRTIREVSSVPVIMLTVQVRGRQGPRAGPRRR